MVKAKSTTHKEQVAKSIAAGHPIPAKPVGHPTGKRSTKPPKIKGVPTSSRSQATPKSSSKAPATNSSSPQAAVTSAVSPKVAPQAQKAASASPSPVVGSKRKWSEPTVIPKRITIKSRLTEDDASLVLKHLALPSDIERAVLDLVARPRFGDRQLPKDIHGKDVSLTNYKEKVLLIVNVASKCGLTDSNYKELNMLYEKYKKQGFEILAFPCNQFGWQEPGSNEEIEETVCSTYKAEFPLFQKIEVNGKNAAPLYKFLKSKKAGALVDEIKWNFAKFLVDRQGNVVGRYAPTTSPLQIEGEIQNLLGSS